MFVDRVVLDNFSCFGPGRVTVGFEEGTTAFIGASGPGETAAREATYTSSIR